MKLREQKRFGILWFSIGAVLCLVTCAQSLIFCGTYWYYNKKY